MAISEYKVSRSPNAHLQNVQWSGANLMSVDLSKALLGNANLSKVDFYGVKLFEADLSGADLSGADLSGAIYQDEKILAAKNLDNTTMPNGQNFLEWVKDRLHIEASGELTEIIQKKDYYSKSIKSIVTDIDLNCANLSSSEIYSNLCKRFEVENYRYIKGKNYINALEFLRGLKASQNCNG